MQTKLIKALLVGRERIELCLLKVQYTKEVLEGCAMKDFKGIFIVTKKCELIIVKLKSNFLYILFSEFHFFVLLFNCWRYARLATGILYEKRYEWETNDVATPTRTYTHLLTLSHTQTKYSYSRSQEEKSTHTCTLTLSLSHTNTQTELLEISYLSPIY